MQKLNDLQLRIIERPELITREDRNKLTIDTLIWWLSMSIEVCYSGEILTEKYETYIWYLEQLKEQGYE